MDNNYSEFYIKGVIDNENMELIVGDATKLNERCDYQKLCGTFDSVYFDAFSPESSPELWTAQTIDQFCRLLLAGGSLTSYCVKSSIRKTLEQSSMTVQRLPGPVGGKREVLVATRRSAGIAE